MSVSLLMLTVGFLLDFLLFKKGKSVEHLGRNMSNTKLTIILTVLIMLIILFYSTSNNFIYFQF